VRAERGFTPKDRFKLYVKGGADPAASNAAERDSNFFREYAYLLIELARLTEVAVEGEAPEGAHHDVVEGFHIAVEFPEKVVTQEQLDRVKREIEKATKELEGVEAKLADERFTKGAPAHIVAGAQARQTELRARLEKLQQNQ
jgi:valyl-tRNA synthetase